MSHSPEASAGYAGERQSNAGILFGEPGGGDAILALAEGRDQRQAEASKPVAIADAA
jgi:hypothetical protein